MISENPTVVVKRRQINAINEFCLDNRIPFRFIPRGLNDEWDVEFEVKEIPRAIILGMFLREQRLELIGHTYISPNKQAAPATRKSKKEQREEEETSAEEIKQPVRAAEPEKIETLPETPLTQINENGDNTFEPEEAPFDLGISTRSDSNLFGDD
jgi:hypothetical protein